MNDLRQELAPLSTEAWSQITTEATRALQVHLAARRLVDFSGSHGWSFAALSRGRVADLGGVTQSGIEAKLRLVQPLVEIRAPFELSLVELEALARGAKDPDLKPLTDAARTAALAEDRAIFHGYSEAGITGIFSAAASSALTLSGDVEMYPRLVAQALSTLRAAGVDGPYALALGPKSYTELTQATTKGGFPVIELVRREIAGPLIWAPALDGAVVLSHRGGDFELTVGQDFSLGYLRHNKKTVTLYIQESFTFTVLTPEAAIPFVYR